MSERGRATFDHVQHLVPVRQGDPQPSSEQLREAEDLLDGQQPQDVEDGVLLQAARTLLELMAAPVVAVA